MAAGAAVFRHRAVIGEGGDLRGILTADGAIDAHGVEIFALLVGCLLRAVAVKDFKNFGPVLERMEHLLRIFAGAVHLRLMAVIHLDAEPADGALKLLLEMLRIGLARRIRERILHIDIWHADACLQLRRNRLHVHRHLAQPVKFIP